MKQLNGSRGGRQMGSVRLKKKKKVYLGGRNWSRCRGFLLDLHNSRRFDKMIPTSQMSDCTPVHTQIWGFFSSAFHHHMSIDSLWKKNGPIVSELVCFHKGYQAPGPRSRTVPLPWLLLLAWVGRKLLRPQTTLFRARQLSLPRLLLRRAEEHIHRQLSPKQSQGRTD